ncbi:MAG: SO_0444 family Cu/Zn efflux transporter [Bacteroidaceae bacterium]|nr:SO_0444 family Cu/Zn efflux transporter [Bacteroidaceae bacterium]
MYEMLQLVNEMSPFLLLGFLLAGLMHAFIPHSIYGKYLSANNWRSVLYATLFGIPLPLCSCGVIPTAMSLRREGASKGSTIAFLVTTPQTGVDSITATYSLMGLPFAIIRPIVAFITAILSGLLCNRFDHNEESTASVEHQTQAPEIKGSFVERMKLALHYGFVDMMQDIGKWLIVGLLVAGAITMLVPDSFFMYFKDNTTLSILFVLVFIFPMYLCATGSIPIAVALMLKGISPGAALVLLAVGPACNVASLLIVGKVLGKRTLLIYVLSIVATSVGAAYVVDLLLPHEWFTSALSTLQTCNHHHIEWFNMTCTVVLFLLLGHAFWLKHHHHKGCGCGCDHHHHHHAECSCNDTCSCTPKAKTVRTYQVSGLHCNHCKANAEKVVAQLEGVERIEVTLATSTMDVEGDVAPEAVATALKSLGFEATLMNE